MERGVPDGLRRAVRADGRRRLRRRTRSARRRSRAASRASRRRTRRSPSTRRSTASRATSWSTTTAPDGLLAQLAPRTSAPSILGVVFAHEFGHAVQSRAGVLDQQLPTITTEQQADCFAGAWVAHAASGDGDGITFTDADVRSGLVAMIQVRDPVGRRPVRPRRPRLGVRPRRRLPDRLHRGRRPLRRADRRPAAAGAEHRSEPGTAPTATRRSGTTRRRSSGSSRPTSTTTGRRRCRRRASRCRRSPSCRCSRRTRSTCDEPAGSFDTGAVLLPGHQPGLLRRSARPGPLRPLRRLRRRLHARRGLERGGPDRPRQPAAGRAAAPRSTTA